MDGNTNQFTPENPPAPTPDNPVAQPAENNKKPNKKHGKLWLVPLVLAGIFGIMVASIITIAVINRIRQSSQDAEELRRVEANFDCPSANKHCERYPSGIISCSCGQREVTFFKPIIYLYPEKETEISVRLGAPEKLTSSYPKYIDGWNVTAYPDGTLVDKSTGNKLYSLYWEGRDSTRDFNRTTGFIVRGTDTIKFLEEKLDILGLNYKEREEFIVYWLPKLEANKYNYIYFETKEEIDTEMPLDFSVQPDTIIRVRMAFEKLDEYKEIEEQSLTPAPERKGFTVVEWGGTDLSE